MLNEKLDRILAQPPARVWIVYDEPDGGNAISLYGVFTSREFADAAALKHAQKYNSRVSVCSQPMDAFIDFHYTTGDWPGADNHDVVWYDEI